MIARIVPASSLQPGPATIIVRLRDRTIRSRVAFAEHDPAGITRVAFASGDIVAFSPRSVVGRVEPVARRRLSPRPRRPRGIRAV